MATSNHGSQTSGRARVVAAVKEAEEKVKEDNENSKNNEHALYCIN
jgi:hypothetical protein